MDFHWSFSTSLELSKILILIYFSIIGLVLGKSEPYINNNITITSIVNIFIVISLWSLLFL